MVLLLTSAPRSLDLIPGGEAAHFTMLVCPHEWLARRGVEMQTKSEKRGSPDEVRGSLGF